MNFENPNFTNLAPTQDYFRYLAEVEEEKPTISSGMAVLALLGSIYLYCFLYLLSTRFLSHLIEDLVYLADYKGEETLPPIVYCSLNSLNLLIFCFISAFLSQSSQGFGTILGSDMFNIGAIYTIMLVKVVFLKHTDRKLDSWFFIRDLFCYIFGLVLLTIFLWGEVQWWMALLMIIYSLLFFFIQTRDADIKEKIFRCVGLTHEDDSFNAEEQMEMKKRSEDIDELVARKFVDHNDEALKKRIARNEGMLIIVNGQDNPKTKLLILWHRAVYTIMFAIKNKHKSEKEQRSIYYKDLWKQKIVDNQAENQSDDQSEAKSPDNQDLGGDDQPFVMSGQPLQQHGQHQEINIKSDEEDENQNKKDKEEEKSVGKIIKQENSDYSDEEVIEINMKFPTELIDRISYIVFFPFHLILYILPNYHQAPSIKKLVLLFLINIGFYILCLYFIEQWMYYVGNTFGIPVTIIGLIFHSILISLPYFVYNMKFIKKDSESIEFFQSFVQLGIYKIGMCSGLPWLFNCMINLQDMVKWIPDQNMQYVCLVFCLMFVIIMIFEIINQFQVNRLFSYALLSSWIIFLIISIVLLSI